MKVVNLLEVHYYDEMQRHGFTLKQEKEREGDVNKIHHYITCPDGKRHYIDHSPYEMITSSAFNHYIDFYHRSGRFPTRSDVDTNGPLTNAAVETLHTQVSEQQEERSAGEHKAIHDLGWAFFKHIGGMKAKDTFLQMAKQHGLTTREQVKQAADFLAYNLTGDIE